MSTPFHPGARSLRSPRPGWVAVAVAGCLAALTACGVREYPHDQATVDTSSDFGPTLVTGGVGGVVVPPTAVAGTSGTPMAVPPATAGATAGSAAMMMTTGGAMAGLPATTTGGTMAGTGGMMLGTGGTMPVQPSGVVIELGGEQVPKEDAIAFIHIGHSNMSGRASTPASDHAYFFTDVDPHAWMYHVGSPPAPALEPDTAGDSLTKLQGLGGPGTALVKEAAALAPGKHFISLGYGVTSAYCSQFLPGGLYYDQMMAATIAIKDRVTFGAIMILLGITERHGTSADITGYSSCINQLVTAIRTDVGRPDLPLLICDYEMEATGMLSATSAFAQQIIPEIHKIPSVVSNSAIVPTDGLQMQDDHHFNLEGHKEYVARLLQIMRDRGWFPWAQP